MSEKTVMLEDLRGVRVLDGRGMFVARGEHESDNATVVVLRLDGQCYWFQEDPSDGYRSDLGFVKPCTVDELPPGSFVTFAPRVLNVGVRTKPAEMYSSRDHVLYGVDERADLVIFEIGTENIDDYYPSFLHCWTPEGSAPEWFAAREEST